MDTLQSNSVAEDRGVPLVVDVDGTLLNSDLLWECLLRYVFPAPWRAFQALYWYLTGGPSLLKFQLSELVTLNQDRLPWNSSVIEYCEHASNTNTEVFLATASNEQFAKRSTRSLTFVTQIFGSSKEHNLKAHKKAQFLTTKFGVGNFDYIGDSFSDIPVWRSCKRPIFVGSEKKRKAIELVSGIQFSKTLESDNPSPKRYLSLIRPHQWVKNALVFLPLLAAHQWMQPSLILTSCIAALSFSAVASCVYVINDLLDIDTDREHPLKRFRPIAAGTVSIPQALICAAALGLMGFLIAAFVSASFLGIISLYFALTLSYSVKFKQSAPLDAVLLAGFYTLRIVAGGVAVNIFPSTWLLLFSSTFFFSLALIKRVSELKKVKPNSHSRRGYQSEDVVAVIGLGAASGLVSVLVVALYVNSPDALPLYHYPQLLLLVCPVLIYWISRLWLLASRGAIHLDPVVFACKDRVSWICGIMIFAILALACR